jgi:hypothetical protein
MQFTHNSTIGKIRKIKSTYDDSMLIFDGIFVAEGAESYYMGDYITHFEIEDQFVAGSSDSDLDYDMSMKFLQDNYSNLSCVELEILYSLTAEDIEVRDFIDSDCSNIPFIPKKLQKIYDSKDEALYAIDGILLGEISWKCQNIRGLLASNQGYSAIAMNDEFGISYFIPYTANFKIID